MIVRSLQSSCHKNTWGHIPSKKVTLRLDDEIVERAKAYCKRHGTNLSRVVETYLAALTDGNYNLMPRVKRLMGTLSAENEREDG